jgi:hypothetical protein
LGRQGVFIEREGEKVKDLAKKILNMEVRHDDVYLLILNTQLKEPEYQAIYTHNYLTLPTSSVQYKSHTKNQQTVRWIDGVIQTTNNQRDNEVCSLKIT